MKGDRVRGKDHGMRGTVTALLSDGRIMVLDDDSEMELPAFPGEWVAEENINPMNAIKPKTETNPSNAPVSRNATIDLHWEKLPPSYKTDASGKLNCQLNYLRDAMITNHNCSQFSIITGRGQGILLNKVKAMLKGNKRLKSIQESGKTAFEGADRLIVEMR